MPAYHAVTIGRGVTLLTPSSDGSAGQYLKTDGAGGLSFDDPVAIGSPVSGGTAGSVLFVDGSGNLGEDNSGLYWDNTSKRLGIGTSPTNTLSVEGVLDIYNWRPEGGVWINMATTGPSGLGSGGAGNNAWIAYAASSGQWFSSSSTGDICYRNITGGLIFGTSSQIPSLVIATNTKVGLNETTPQARQHITLSDPAEVGQIIQLASSQTANAFEIQDSTGSSILSIDHTGRIIGQSGSSPSAPIFGFQTGQNTRAGMNHILGPRSLMFVVDDQNRLNLRTLAVAIRSDMSFVWSSSTDPVGTADVGLSRYSSGVLAVGDGTAADYSGTLLVGQVGINEASPTSILDLTAANGYAQLRLRTSYTPTGTADTNGNTGDVAWDDNYWTIKNNNGWYGIRLTPADDWPSTRLKAAHFEELTINTPAGTTQTIDWTQSNKQKLDLSSATGDVTVDFVPPKGPCSLQLLISQGTTARDITWPTSVKWDNDVGEPIWNADTNLTRIVSFLYDGTNYFAAASATYS